MGDRRFNLSDRDRLIIARALRARARELRDYGPPDDRSYAWEEAAQCEYLADRMGTSA